MAARVPTGQPVCPRALAGGSTEAVASAAQRHAARPTSALLAGLPVDRLTHQIGVAVVTGVLLDHVKQNPAQARGTAVGPGALGQLIKACGGKRLRRTGPR